MISIHKDTINSCIAKHKDEYEKHISWSKSRITNLIESNTYYGDELKYLKEIEKNIEKIALADTDEIINWMNSFEKIIPACYFKNSNKKNFKEAVINALDYTKLRDEFLAKYFASLEIKTCVYCNNAPTISFYEHKQENKYRARFQTDHYHSQFKYPFLSISLFNLFPSCGPCNNIKSGKQLEFELYTSNFERAKKSDYTFKLKGASLSKYLLNRKIEDLQVVFIEPLVSSPAKTFKEVFDIEGIYNTQKDLAEELIKKAEHYNKPYKKFLRTAFHSIVPASSLSGRLLIGNYTEPENIHKRPMAKFTQDIARQLKLI